MLWYKVTEYLNIALLGRHLLRAMAVIMSSSWLQSSWIRTTQWWYKQILLALVCDDPTCPYFAPEIMGSFYASHNINAAWWPHCWGTRKLRSFKYFIFFRVYRDVSCMTRLFYLWKSYIKYSQYHVHWINLFRCRVTMSQMTGIKYTEWSNKRPNKL